MTGNAYGAVDQHAANGGDLRNGKVVARAIQEMLEWVACLCTPWVQGGCNGDRQQEGEVD